ncbi:hypothetical protein ACLOJK_011010 [Asimina triloba]
MKLAKTIFIIMAIAMALAMACIATATPDHELEDDDEEDSPFYDTDSIPSSLRGLSRFLAEKELKCHENPAVCHTSKRSPGPNCCQKKCVDLKTDNDNCGICEKKCKYTEACCRGQCVNLSFDKRHCGRCNHRCDRGDFCIYGMCNYA